MIRKWVKVRKVKAIQVTRKIRNQHKDQHKTRNNSQKLIEFCNKKKIDHNPKEMIKEDKIINLITTDLIRKIKKANHFNIKTVAIANHKKDHQANNGHKEQTIKLNKSINNTARVNK